MARGLRTKLGWSEPAIFTNFGCHIFKKITVEAKYAASNCFMLQSVFIVGFTRFSHVAFEDSYVKTNEDTSILSAGFWRYNVYADIRQGTRALT